MAAGIDVRHRQGCRELQGGRCNCKPAYRAWAWSQSDGRKVRRTFRSLAEAKAWRRDAQVALDSGVMRAPSTITLDEAAEAWLAGARAGTITNRSGDPYKPSAVRTYERALRLRVLPEFGSRSIGDLRRAQLQEFVDELVSDGHSASTIQVTLMPLRAIFRREVSRGRMPSSPTDRLELPAVRGGRERIASPSEARRLLEALPAEDRALWATAICGGLRRGELMALR